MTSSDSFIEITPDTFNLPSLSPSISDTLSFSYTIGDCRPHISSLTLWLGEDSTGLSIPVTRPVLFASYMGNGFVSGDTNNVELILGNRSPSPARDVTIRVNSSDPEVQVLNDSLFFAEITHIATCTLSVYVNEGVSIGERFTLVFHYRASGYEDSFAVDGVVGNLTYQEDFESLPEGWTIGDHWSIVNRRHFTGER